VKGGFLLKYGVSLKEWKGRNRRKRGIQQRLHTVQRIAAAEGRNKKELI